MEKSPIPEFYRDQESREGQELFRATLSFDFIFVRNANGDHQCYCVEINGDNSGIAGIQQLPRGSMDETERILAEIRDRRNPERLRRVAIAEDIFASINENQSPVTPSNIPQLKRYMKQSVMKEPLLKYAFRNPKIIQDIANDKSAQEKFIPPENEPRVFHPGESPISKTGAWIVKPRFGLGGIDIRILTNEEFLATYNASGYDLIQNNLVQEFIPDSSADYADECMKKNPASMRLLIDFRYFENGNIDVVYETAYSRVSPHTPDKSVNSKKGEPVTREDAYVVNKNKGAVSAPVSEEELEIARKIAKKIIHSIAREYVEQQKK